MGAQRAEAVLASFEALGLGRDSEIGARRGAIGRGIRLASGRQGRSELRLGSLRAVERPLRGEVTWLEAGGAALTAPSLGAGDAGNGHPAPVPKAPGIELTRERGPGSVAEALALEGESPRARELRDHAGTRDNKSAASVG